MFDIDVRYEDHNPGGSVWVRTQNRLDYSDEWICVWSTEPGNRGQYASVVDPTFPDVTRPGPPIPIPYDTANGHTTPHPEPAPLFTEQPPVPAR